MRYEVHVDAELVFDCDTREEMERTLATIARRSDDGQPVLLPDNVALQLVADSWLTWDDVGGEWVGDEEMVREEPLDI